MHRNHPKILYDIELPNHTAWEGKSVAIARFVGCNMRCLHCRHIDLVMAGEGNYDIETLYTRLQKHRRRLHGLVLSGGEATIHDLEPICRRIKEMNLALRLDTNGLRPELLAKLLEKSLLDHVVLDYKAHCKKFGYITGSGSYHLFVESLELLIRSAVECEVRTTFHPDLLNAEDLRHMAEFLVEKGYKGTYFLRPLIPPSRSCSHLDEMSILKETSTLFGELTLVWR